MPNARLLALQLLKTWDRSQSYAQDLLGTAFEKTALATNDRALVQHLLFGVLRHRRMLDHWIGHLREGKLDDDTRSLLQLGLFQLFHTRIPDHAAVNETLRLASQRSRGLANAVLRRATRERDALEALAAAAPAPLRHSLPDFLHEKWLAQFGEEETEKLCQWSQTPAPNYLRRNDLRPEAKALINDHGLKPAQVDEREDFYEVSEIPQAIIDAGAGYIQDPATVHAVDLLAPKSGHRVLDACAAPGGKTAYIAQLMGNEGTFIATDSLEDRMK
ncbi:MAG: transcription antitermination factor NusB, partial [Verrucomicrobiales bacterium]